MWGCHRCGGRGTRGCRSFDGLLATWRHSIPRTARLDARTTGMDELAAVRAEQAARYAAAKAAEPEQERAVGSSKRKTSLPKKHTPGGAAGGPGAGVAAEKSAPAAKHARGSAPKALAVPTKHARVTTLSVDALATAFYTSGSGTGDAHTRLQSQGDAENRVRAVEDNKYTCDDAKGGRLTVTYRAVRHDIEERVQALSREETLDVLVAVVRRATTSRRGGGGAGLHLIAPREQAARSSCVFWNAVRHFGSPRAAAEAARDVVQPAAPVELEDT